MPRKINWSICSQMNCTVTFYSLVKRESEVVPTTNSTSDIYVVYKEARLVGISVSKPVVEVFTLITVRIVVPDIARVWSTCKCFVGLHLLVFFTFFAVTTIAAAFVVTVSGDRLISRIEPCLLIC